MIHLRFGKFLASLLCVSCLLVSFSSQASAVLTPLNDDTMFVEQVYQDFLNRTPDVGGLAYWVGEIEVGNITWAQVVENYINSAEFGLKVSPVARLYFAYFNRIPDYDGLMYWVGEFGLGAPLGAISDAFAESPEFISTYGSLSNQAFVNLVYQNVLDRTPDADGLAYWIGELDTGRVTRGEVMTGFSESDEYQNMMYNKVYVTMTYIGLLRRAPEQDGFDFWVESMDLGVSGLGLIDGFLSSEEYAVRFGVNLPIAYNGEFSVEENYYETSMYYYTGVLQADFEEWFSIETNPSHGWLSCESSGTYTYTPDDYYVGPDSFTFTAINEFGVSSPATISITVEDYNPYVINDNDTVSDLSTGVVWQQGTAPGDYDWYQAMDYCEALSHGGLPGWRLPTKTELMSLLRADEWPKVDNRAFPDTIPYSYWSSDTDGTYSSYAYSFGFGNTNRLSLSRREADNDFKVRCVTAQ